MSNITGLATKLQVTRDTGNKRVKEQVELLLINPADATARSKRLIAITPSRRISFAIEVWFEADNGVSTLILAYPTSNWDIIALARGVNTGFNLLHTLQSAQIIPKMYELDSALRGIYVAVHMKAATNDGTPVAGKWYCRGYWEPNTPMDDSELTSLFSACQLLPVTD